MDLKRHKGMMRGVIEEKRINFSSWVWMGSFSLGFFLERIERSFLDTKEEQWVWSWKEEGRRYQMAKDRNHVGPIVSLKVIDAGGKNFSIFVPIGERNGRGWREMTDLLRELGVQPHLEMQKRRDIEMEEKKRKPR